MSIYQVFQTRNRTRPNITGRQRDKGQSIDLIYVSQFTELRDAIEAAQETFSQEQIWPDQCDYVIHRIGNLKKAATSIANLANSAKQQDGKLSGGKRYSLLVSAHFLCEKTDILITHIREYKEIRDHQSAKRSKHRLIASSLDHLGLTLSDLMKELERAT